MTHLEKILSTHGFKETDETQNRMNVWVRRNEAALDEYVLVDERQRRWIYSGNGEIKGTTLRKLAEALGLKDDRIFQPEDFSRDETGHLGLLPAAFLAAVARGEINLNAMAKQELADSGLDEYGDWIGHDNAAIRMDGHMIPRADGRRVWTSIPR